MHFASTLGAQAGANLQRTYSEPSLDPPWPGRQSILYPESPKNRVPLLRKNRWHQVALDNNNNNNNNNNTNILYAINKRMQKTASAIPSLEGLRKSCGLTSEVAGYAAGGAIINQKSRHCGILLTASAIPSLEGCHDSGGVCRWRSQHKSKKSY